MSVPPTGIVRTKRRLSTRVNALAAWAPLRLVGVSKLQGRADLDALAAALTGLGL